MGRLRNKADGLGFPKPGTQVRFTDGPHGSRVKYLDKTVYVCSYEPSSDRGIVVNSEPGKVHGNYCTHWEEVSVLDTLTDEQKKEISQQALDAASNRGYCDETKNILQDLGLPTSFPKKRIVTVEFEVEEDPHYKFSVNRIEYASTTGHVRVLGIKEVL